MAVLTSLQRYKYRINMRLKWLMLKRWMLVCMK